MKKHLLVLITLLASVYAQASKDQVVTLNCKLEKFPNQVISFKMQNLGTEDMTYLNEDPEDDSSAVFTTTSKDKTVTRLVDTLNGQGGDLRIETDRIEFFGDSAGIDFAYLNLFKTTKYTKGFVRIEFEDGRIRDYSKISCEIKK